MYEAPEWPRRVEEACLNGWPALRHIVDRGLLLRFADGYTRRSNSVNAIGSLAGDPVEAIRRCEAAYRANGLPTVFRLSSAFDVGLGPALDAAGYAPPEDPSVVLFRHLDDATLATDADPVRPDPVSARPDEAWLEALARIQGQSADVGAIHRSILEALAVPAGFGAVRVEGVIAALCFGAIHDGIVCVNSVATDPRWRRRGLAQAAIRSVLAWSRHRHGAEAACVPVVAGNAAAIGLYRGMGFDREILRYHYRRRLEKLEADRVPSA